jgi:hypothetical protein
MLVFKGGEREQQNLRSELFYTILMLGVDFGIIFYALGVVFIQRLDLSIFQPPFPKSLKVKIMNKSMLNRLEDFSFRELLVDF